MANFEHSIDVHVPVSTAYNQWTQFEEFPRFMEGVREVRQLGDKRLHWRAEIGGREKEWDAEITEQVRDERVAWRAVTGTPNAGVVTFHRIDPDTTRVMLQVDYEPEGMMENIGEALGMAKGRIEEDLERFRDFIEQRQRETGAWRGEIRRGEQEEVA
jgi:uncharacterized membrane protein